MKTKSNFKFVSSFKYLMLIPVLLAVVAIVFGFVFNLNYDYDFRTVNNFSVKFGTTVSEAEYDMLEKNLNDLITRMEFDNFRLERVGSGAQNGILVKIPNDNGALDARIEELKEVIEESLITSYQEISSSIVISTTDTGFSLPKNITNLVLYSSIAVLCILAFVFFYNWIRFNLISGVSAVMVLLLDVAMLFAAMVAFRIPFNYYFVVPFFVMILTSVVNMTYHNNYVKGTLNLESYNKTTNADRVEEATTKTFKGVALYSSVLLAITLATIFFGSSSLIYLGLAIIVGVVISTFNSMFIAPSLWALWYKREKDSILKRRLEAAQRKEDIKSGKIKEDKIVA